MIIEITAKPEDRTPEQSEKDSVEGFADGVRDMQNKAEGNWGWCQVEVKVATQGGFIAVGTSHLGECSYENELDFILNSGYFKDMISEAVLDLESKS